MVRQTAATSGDIIFYKNNSLYRYAYLAPTSGAGKPFALEMDLLKGDTISIRTHINATLSNIPSAHHLTISRLNTSTPIFAKQPEVYLHYVSTAGASVSSSGTNLVRATKVEATHNGWYNTTTGAITPQWDCTAQIDAGFYTATTGTGIAQIFLREGSADVKALGANFLSASVQNVAGSGVYRLKKGVTYYARAYSRTTGNESVSNSEMNYITISTK
jgi:hypothetical protein